MAAFDNCTADAVQRRGTRARDRASSCRARIFLDARDRTARGRTFRAEEDAVGNAADVVVLSDGSGSGGSAPTRTSIGRTITLNTRACTVVGIMPPGFKGLTDSAELWVPFAFQMLCGGTGAARQPRLRTGGAIEGRRQPGERAGRDGHHRAASRGRVSPIERKARRRGQPARRRARRLAAACAADADGRGRVRPAHRVRERRESAAHPVRSATPRDRGPHGSGRRPRTPVATADHGKLRSHAHRRRRRTPARASGGGHAPRVSRRSPSRASSRPDSICAWPRSPSPCRSRAASSSASRRGCSPKPSI